MSTRAAPGLLVPLQQGGGNHATYVLSVCRLCVSGSGLEELSCTFGGSWWGETVIRLSQHTHIKDGVPYQCQPRVVFWTHRRVPVRKNIKKFTL